MIKLIKRYMSLGIFLILVCAGISFYLYVHDLRVRFPNLDFSTARFGVASWYSKTDKRIQKYTANGEVFNDKKYTCASWDYPFNTRLLVINPLNGKWIVCRVNDRGPAKHLNREIDLTKKAFKVLANPKRGLIYVTFLPVKKKR